ncbi:hypothetical protein T484DRAFT_1809751 [Baffinella frigidus]|nr:hypothetical protein T484DRAFT_1809751 [Cryptophyta sp. CCMP2293]
MVEMVQCLAVAMLRWPYGIDRFCKHYSVTRNSVLNACNGVGTTWTDRSKKVYTGPQYVTMRRSKSVRKPRFTKCPIGMATAASNLAASNLAVSDLAASDLAVSDLAASNLAASNLAASDLAVSDLAASDLAASDLAASDLAASDLAASLWTDIVSEEAVAVVDNVSEEALVLPDTNALSYDDSVRSYRDHQKLCYVCGEKLIFINHCITDGCRMQDIQWD